MDKQERERQREAVKTLAIAVGVREAARQLGINQNTVRQWSSRFKWFKQPDSIPVPPTITKQNGLSITSVTKPSEALRIALEDDSRTTKLGLSKAARRAAETFQGMTGAGVIKRAKQLKEVTGTAAQIHNWEGQHGSSNLDINVLAGGRAMIQVVQGPGAVSE